MSLPATFLALDFETTGRDPRACGIVEVAVARVLDGVIGDRWSSLCSPGMPVDPGAAAVHGISDAEIAAAPPVAELLPELYGWLLDGLPLVAYNGNTFDKLILERVFTDAGVELPALVWHDPLPVARALVPSLRHFKLGQVGSALNVLRDGATLHRAAADLDVLIGVTLELRRRQLAAMMTTSVTVQASPELEAAIAAGGHVGGTIQVDEPPPFLAPAPALPAASLTRHGEDDLPPLVLDARRALVPLQGKVAKWIKAADGLPCDNDADEERVVNAIATFKQLIREAEKLRGTFTDEIGKQKRRIEADFRADVQPKLLCALP